MGGVRAQQPMPERSEHSVLNVCEPLFILCFFKGGSLFRVLGIYPYMGRHSRIDIKRTEWLSRHPGPSPIPLAVTAYRLGRPNPIKRALSARRSLAEVGQRHYWGFQGVS